MVVWLSFYCFMGFTQDMLLPMIAKYSDSPNKTRKSNFYFNNITSNLKKMLQTFLYYKLFITKLKTF